MLSFLKIQFNGEKKSLVHVLAGILKAGGKKKIHLEVQRNMHAVNSEDTDQTLHSH